MLASLLGGCLVHVFPAGHSLVGSLEENVGFLSSIVQPATVLPFINLDVVCGEV